MVEQLRELTERLEKIEVLLEQLVMRRDERGYDDDVPLNMKQAAAYLQLSVSRMYKLIYEGRLKPIQRVKNSKILFSKEELHHYLKKGNAPLQC